MKRARQSWSVRTWGIRGRLLLSFSVLTAAIAVFAAVYFPARMERQALREVKAKTETIRTLTAYTLRAALYFGDVAAVNEVIAGAAEYRDLRWIAVRDTMGRVIAARGTEVPGAVTDSDFTSADGLIYASTSPILHEGIRVGTVTTAVSLEAIRHEASSARRAGVLAGLLIFALGLAVIWIIGTLVTRPLTHLVETVRRIAAGDLTVRAVERSDADVSELVRAFNGMVGNLADAQGELTRMNADLEARVIQRTSQLQDAIGRQQRAQEALARSEAQARSNSETLQSLIDVAPQAIVTVDLEWHVTRWNAAAEAMFGWTAAEVLGRPLPYIADENREEFRDIQRLIERDEAKVARECLRRRKDGSFLTCLVSAAVLRDRVGGAIGYIGVLNDLSERKSLESALRQSQKMEAVGRLAGGIAHDFNNILTIITATAGLLLGDERTDEDRRDLEEILTASRRASSLTRQLLTFSRQGVVQLESVQVNGILRNVGPLLRRLLRSNIDLTFDLGATAGTVRADASQVEQVIMNLVVNASDAMPDGGSLHIGTRELFITGPDAERLRLAPGAYVELTTRDTGVGMHEATLHRIFEPFFTTKPLGQGTGLGLATTYAIVTQLGGQIRVVSAPSRGSTFTIYFPLEPDGGLSLGEAIAEAPPRGASGPMPSVLLVEDEAGVRSMLKRILERAGMPVLDAEDATRALAIAGAPDAKMDVVVTDVMMPGMNGRVLADRLAERFPEVSVVFISGYADEVARGLGLVNPKHYFLQKPFAAQDLIALILQAAGTAAEVAAP